MSRKWVSSWAHEHLNCCTTQSTLTLYRLLHLQMDICARSSPSARRKIKIRKERKIFFFRLAYPISATSATRWSLPILLSVSRVHYIKIYKFFNLYHLGTCFKQRFGNISQTIFTHQSNVLYIYIFFVDNIYYIYYI